MESATHTAACGQELPRSSGDSNTATEVDIQLLLRYLIQTIHNRLAAELEDEQLFETSNSGAVPREVAPQ